MVFVISLHHACSCPILLQSMAEKLIGSLFEMTVQNIWVMEFPATSHSGIEVSNASVTPSVQKGAPSGKMGVPWTTADMLWIYLGPCIFLTGVCGNILILVVMCQSRMKGTSTCIYLQTMALADLVAITTGVVPDWLTAVDIVTLKEVHPALCKIEKFLFYTGADTSIWACVIFTIDRFIAVCFPMESMQRCPPHQAKFYAAAAFVAAMVKNFHVLFTRGQEWRTEGNETIFVSNCGSPNDACKHFEKFVRPWIAFAVVNLMPFCIIVFCNLFIVRAMIRLRQSHRISAIITAKDSNTVTQMSALCLSASICFLICVTPSMILLIGKPYWTENPLPNPSYDLAKAAGNLIFYINHSINFFLYCMTGAKFRMELQSLISKKSTTLAKGSTAARNSGELVITYKMQKDRLGTIKGGKSGLYSSAPCITDFICKPLPPQSQYQTFLQDSIGADRIRAASDLVLVNGTGYESQHSLFSKESRI